MFRKLQSVRLFLLIGLLLSIIYAGYGIYYKIRYWGFSFQPNQMTDVWTVEANISFEPTGDPIRVSISRPINTGSFKILDENIIAPRYQVQKDSKRIILSSSPRQKNQNIYYRVLLYDNVAEKKGIKDDKPHKVDIPLWDEQRKAVAYTILDRSKAQEGDRVQQIIRLLSQTPPDETVLAFMPERKSLKETADVICDLLAFERIPVHIVRGVRLEKDKKTFKSDVMIEAYLDSQWIIYNIETGEKGLPKDFIIFQRGGNSLVDVEGGENSLTRFSVMKSLTSSFNMAEHRAKTAHQEKLFAYSMYSLPLSEQNSLKWLMIFPLAILVVVVMRNMVGLKTMGTFTPMLIAMALVETGFVAGLVCFSIIVIIGLLIRAGLSRLNLLLVPRISAVVIFVILMIQIFTILGYHFHWDIASSALFFPIIIMAWIIERASIIWEEEGLKNAGKEVFFSVVVAVFTYFIIVNDYIRHIMFAFSELNLVLLFIVMLLGTYTGYRLTELIRFAPLSRSRKE